MGEMRPRTSRRVARTQIPPSFSDDRGEWATHLLVMWAGYQLELSCRPRSSRTSPSSESLQFNPPLPPCPAMPWGQHGNYVSPNEESN